MNEIESIVGVSEMGGGRIFTITTKRGGGIFFHDEAGRVASESTSPHPHFIYTIF